MENVKRAAVAISACAALALPASALANHGAHSPHEHANSNAGKAHGHRHDRNAILKGSVASIDGNVVTVNVTGGNHAGRSFNGQAVQIDLTGARLVVADVNGDGSRDLSDVVAGDAVVIQAWVPRDGNATQPLSARRLVDQGAAESSDTQDTQETPAG